MAKIDERRKNDYKVIISELGVNPFHAVDVIFALMCVIPLLAVCYIIIGKYFLYNLFLDENALEMVIAIFIALIGLLYAYRLVRNLIEKLLRYAEESKIAENQKTELLITVSNDLRAPLTALKAGIFDIINCAGDVLKGADATTAKSCIGAAETLTSFIEKIVNLPKIGLIRMGIKREFIDLKDIIRDELDGLMQLIRKNKIDLQCAFTADNTNLWGDEKKLSKAIGALLSNALRYTPEMGVISVTLSSNEDTVQLSVKNTGPGLSPEEMDRIFEKSEKLNDYLGIKSTEAELSIVKDIIDLHNGRIIVNNVPHKEMEFRILLPRDLRMRSGLQEFNRKMTDNIPLPADANMHIAEVINQKLKDLVDFYKVDAGKLRLKREYVDIIPLVDEVLSNQEVKFSEKRLVLKKYIPHDIGSLWCDKNKLREVITNLLGYSIKNTPSGGRITVKLTGDVNEMHFEISDTGPGIAKEYLDKLFDKIEHVTAGNIENVNLNFPVTKEIIELHKGKVSASSELGKGTRFTFTLPKDLRK